MVNVDLLSSSAQGTGGSSNGDHISDRSQGLPLKYLLPAILVPILLIGCCLVCCVKCCLHNEDCDEIRSCWRNKGTISEIIKLLLLVISSCTSIRFYIIGMKRLHFILPKSNVPWEILIRNDFKIWTYWTEWKGNTNSRTFLYSHIFLHFSPSDKKKTLEIEETSSSPTGFHQSTSYQFASSHGHLALGQCEREPLNNQATNNHFHQVCVLFWISFGRGRERERTNLHLRRGLLVFYDVK